MMSFCFRILVERLMLRNGDLPCAQHLRCSLRVREAINGQTTSLKLDKTDEFFPTKIFLFQSSKSENISRGAKHLSGNHSLPHKTYFPKGLTLKYNHYTNSNTMQFGPNKKLLMLPGHPLSGVFREKTIDQNSLRMDKLFGAYRPCYTQLNSLL